MILAGFSGLTFGDYAKQTGITLAIVFISTLFAYCLGIPLGIVLHITDKNGICKCRVLHQILGVSINVLRSAPFIILLVTLLPYIRKVIGTGTGNIPFIIALVIAAVPFVARMVESSLKEMDYGVIEAALAMGASRLEIIFKILLPETKISLIVGATISFSTILGYTAMAGTIGAEGLGNVAYMYGYLRNFADAKFISLILLVLIVQVFQELGMLISKKLDHRKKGE